jgi:hypothetical protein
MPDKPTLEGAEADLRDARERVQEVSAVLRHALADDDALAAATEDDQR